MGKRSLRQKMLCSRKRLSASETTNKSLKIAKTLLDSTEFTKSRSILIYIPINKEVETKQIIDSLIKRGSKIYLPSYSKKRKDWCISEFSDWKNLESGYKNIPQPKIVNIVDSAIIDIAIIPGVAFSEDGVRLGYGMGVFDKLLVGSRALKIGLAYEFQIVENVPYEKHDLKMDMIVTEKRVIRVGRATEN